MTGPASRPRHDAVLVVAFGGPTRPGDADPFVRGVLGPRSMTPELAARIRLVVSHYEAVGGVSPFNDHTRAQARALSWALRARGIAIEVEVGMRLSEPRLADVLGTLHARGRRRVLAVIMAVFQNAMSWDAYLEALAVARGAIGAGAPEVDVLDPWHDHPGLVAANAGRIEEATAALDPERRARVLVVFTAHAVPEAIARASPYPAQFERTAGMVARARGLARYRIAYQSGAARPPAWTGPDVTDVIAQAAREGVADLVVCPLGFLCDHVEVLYDLDVAARAAADASGVALHRAPTVGTHPGFIGMLADLVAARIEERSP